MKRILILAALATVSLASCDKVKDATSKDITVNGVEFQFTGNTEAVKSGASITRSAATTSTFSVTKEVDISDLSDSEVIEYADKISKVKVNSSLVKVTMDASGVVTVTNFEITAEGVDGSIKVPSYTVGEDFVPTKEMNAYTAALIKKLLDSKKLKVTVKGETDAPAGTKVTVRYKNDIVFTLSLL